MRSVCLCDFTVFKVRLQYFAYFQKRSNIVRQDYTSDNFCILHRFHRAVVLKCTEKVAFLETKFTNHDNQSALYRADTNITYALLDFDECFEHCQLSFSSYLSTVKHTNIDFEVFLESFEKKNSSKCRAEDFPNL